MKMRWYDSILVSLSGLVLTALGVFVMLAGSGVIKLPEPLTLDAWLGSGWQWMPLVFLAGLVFIAWGLWLLLRPFMRRGESRGRYYTVHDGGVDSVQISIQALDHLVHKCLDRRGEILSSNVRISGQEDAMRILLRITVRSGVTIPTLVAQVRKEIKCYVEQCAGVVVESVQIVVEATKDAKGTAFEPELLPPPMEAGSIQATMEEPMEQPDFSCLQTVWEAEPAEAYGAEPIPEEERTHIAAEPEKEPEAEAIPLSAVLPDDIPEAPPIPLSGKAFPFPGEDIPVWNQSSAVADDTEDGRGETHDA